MNINGFLKFNALLLAGFFSLSANADLIVLDDTDIFVDGNSPSGVYLGNDADAADFMADTGITGVTELFRDIGFCDVNDGVCETPNGVFAGTVDKVDNLDYLVVKFDGVYGVYDVMQYDVGVTLQWHTADFASGCAELGALGNNVNCTAATSHVSGYGVVPVPAAVWLFGTGLLGLVGVARRKA